MHFQPFFDQSHKAFRLSYLNKRAERKHPNHQFCLVVLPVVDRDAVVLFVQPLRLFFKVRKVKQHPFQGIASVIQLDHNAFVCGGTDALAPVPFSPKGLTGQNPPKIDGFSVPAAGGDQAELVVLFGITRFALYRKLDKLGL